MNQAFMFEEIVGTSPALQGVLSRANVKVEAVFLPAILVLLCWVPLGARAQTFSSLAGVVKDSSGAMIVQAKVTAENR
jgi:hypothetical protein